MYVEETDMNVSGPSLVVIKDHDNRNHALGCPAVMPALTGTLEHFFLSNIGAIDAKDRDRALQLLEVEKRHCVEAEFFLWTETRELCGISTVLNKCQQFATFLFLMCGRSAQFDSDVFDRHGAWVIHGQPYLHLIKRSLCAFGGDHLVIGHRSLEVTDIDRVREIFQGRGSLQ